MWRLLFRLYVCFSLLLENSVVVVVVVEAVVVAAHPSWQSDTIRLVGSVI